MSRRDLPLPPHYDSGRLGEVWRPQTEALAEQADGWRERHDLKPGAEASPRVALLLVDLQNSFCTPGFELFVTGRSGRGAVDDNRRLCEFLYRNLGVVSHISATMDTHQPYQIFHPCFWIDEQGEHPAPFTLITADDVAAERWTVDPQASTALGLELDYLERHAHHYTRSLQEGGKYDLTIWPYHVLLGSPGHALASSVQEAVFFHSPARQVQPDFYVKGDNPLTEHYSVLGPEVDTGPDGEVIDGRAERFVRRLLSFDAVIVAGQAKSHCLAWTIGDLVEEVEARDGRLAERIYLLEDCTSPVVVPGAFDYTEEADAAFRRFEQAGMKVVRSTTPIDEWPGLVLRS